jgi:DNA (cytosine-5)-methyltransferase 1
MSIYGRMVWDAPSPTITTQFYGYGNGRFGHPEQDRALTLREVALLQSFPPNYAFVALNKSLIVAK